MVKHSSGKAALSQAEVCRHNYKPPKIGEIAGKVIREAQGSSGTIGNYSGHQSVMHWHSAPHQLALRVLWEELSSDWFNSRKTPGFGKQSKRKGGLYS